MICKVIRCIPKLSTEHIQRSTGNNSRAKLTQYSYRISGHRIANHFINCVYWADFDIKGDFRAGLYCLVSLPKEK
jgi:hypothetical protein